MMQNEQSFALLDQLNEVKGDPSQQVEEKYIPEPKGSLLAAMGLGTVKIDPIDNPTPNETQIMQETNTDLNEVIHLKDQ